MRIHLTFILLPFAISAISSEGMAQSGSKDRTSVKAMDLPEVLVESRKNSVLHILAYLREYSTMTTYSDTVFMFREKLVDYMLPVGRKVKFHGWTKPRMLTSKSYYRFSDHNGLDSISDEYRFHFSWSDWMGLVPNMPLPERLQNSDIGTDTIHGKFRPAEIWNKDNDRLRIDIDVREDTLSRRWAPAFDGFFRSNFEFDKFRIGYN